MAKKKNFWYVIVMADDGPAFVTRLGDHHTAYWKKDEKPYEMGESWAKDVAQGLLLNWFSAFPVCSPIELDRQPYNYGKWRIEWKEIDTLNDDCQSELEEKEKDDEQ